MTASRLLLPNSCVEMGVRSTWSTGYGCCLSCRQEVRYTYERCGCKRVSSPLSPHSPFTFAPHQGFFPNVLQYNEVVERLAETIKALKQSGWYYGNLDWQGARSLLKEASPGAFLVRNSGDRNFIFSLSIQTEKGPTSVRLHYERRFFRLDCEESVAKYMPRFRCVVDLVEHYAHSNSRRVAGTVWVDREGVPHSPVLLKYPLIQKPPSLLHAARLAVHRSLDSNPLTPKLRNAPKHKQLPLPSTLLDYLGDYPYAV